MVAPYTQIRKSGPNFDTRFSIPVTNAIESLNRVIRKTTKTRGSFPTDDAATKLIYLAIRSFEKTGRAVREWVAARNQFAILYPEQFNK
nr:transposase [Neptunicoccus sediminis]